MIDLQDVSFGWPDSPPAFSGLTLRIAAGEKVVLLGPNGSGKSTLLKLLNGLIDPTGGRYCQGGEEVTLQHLRDRDRARRFRRECVLLFQHPEAMLFNATVRDEIAYGPRQLDLADVDARVTRWARELRLEALLDKPPFHLSGGEKQKVALAAVLALDPKVLLLDEPSANLDPRTAGWLADHLLDTGATVVVSTHNLSMAAEFGERCLILDPGRGLRYDGPIERALADVELLEAAQLAHRHRHRHGAGEHAHMHLHAWETPD
ncbi:ABC transporter [Methylibium sp. Pch-M]|uniref:energy-coupling factor ABC transporter ATP-binding protein n=1 Tax=Methylibium sp. Pch-M TaxID=2082386 RepID=UPI0010108F68|nr:ABC transporter ATP-binding protein [Methylibium sp. Pch-M]QAZ38606.1 ABC transporter [Methylibium sp. Pch-M]